MPRIFAGLAVSQLLVTLGAGGLGLAGFEAGPDRHILLAVLAILLSCFIQVLAFTYLTVTGKMIAQAVHLGDMPLDLVMTAKRFKRSFTHQLGLLLAAWVVSAATGGHLWRVSGSAFYHSGAAVLFVAAHLYVYYRQFDLILRNVVLVDRTLADYRRKKDAADPRSPSVAH